MSGEGIWKRIVAIRRILLWFLTMILLWHPMSAYGKEYDFPKDVVIVRNEKQMLKSMMKRMRKHEACFSYYYPGIVKDVKKYQKESPAYTTFMGKLSKLDGYVTGVVSGVCIFVVGEKDKYVTYQFGYLTTRSQEKKIDKKVKKIVKKIGSGSRAKRAKKAHDYLISHMRYDTRYYSPYHAFTKGRGMCMSYALAYQCLLQEMKIPCVYVKGKNHAWNMVKLGGYWYNVDVTWDDAGKGRYRYFLKADKDFPGHKTPKWKYLSSLRRARNSYPLSKIP